MLGDEDITFFLTDLEGAMLLSGQLQQPIA